MNNHLRIGTGLASRSILVSLTEQFPKMLIGITKPELSENKDAMNFGIVQKVCDEKVLSKLTQKQEYGTMVYLQLNQHIMIAYINSDSTPTERLHSAWYTAFFCRLWKESIAASQQVESGRDDLYEPTLKDSFISSNLHVCIELNGHGLLRFLIECRDLGKPELFPPSQTGSQQCEAMFRSWRSMTSTFFTAINFDMMEILQKVKRLFFADKITTSSIDFKFARQNKKGHTFVPESLPDNAEINEIVSGGWEEAKKVFCNLGKADDVNRFLGFLFI